MNIYVVIAQPSEYELVKRFNYDKVPVIITGVGAMNVINALKGLPKDSWVINVGYCGSNVYDVGTVCHIGYVETLAEKCKLLDEPLMCNELDSFLKNWVKGIEEDCCCVTSTDFVTETKMYEGCFDMELAFIRAMFDNVTAIKVVSDKLNYEEYDKNVNKV